ncbi:hypothetical protein CR513_56808, partial [Mucuna pruriens]
MDHEDPNIIFLPSWSCTNLFVKLESDSRYYFGNVLTMGLMIGLRPQTKILLDALAGGSMNTKTTDEALIQFHNFLINFNPCKPPLATTSFKEGKETHTQTITTGGGGIILTLVENKMQDSQIVPFNKSNRFIKIVHTN